MKKFITFFAAVLFSSQIYALPDAEYVVDHIEELKTELSYIIAKADNSDSSQKRHLRHELYTAYLELEKTVFHENSEDKEFLFKLDSFDTETQSWPLTVKKDIFRNYGILNQTVLIPYNVFTGKKFVSAEKMTLRQKEDYEETVNNADQLFNDNANSFFADFSFKLIKWDEASQYRFIPQSLSIYFIHGSTKTHLVTLQSDSLETKTFTVFPQVEVRNETQIKSDRQKNAALLAREKSAPAEPVKEKKPAVSQKGRRTFYINLDSQREKIKAEDFKYKNIQLSTASGILTFGLGKYAFGGVSFGYDLDSINTTSIYEFGLLTGANLNLTNFIRPYIEAGAGLTTGNRLFAKAGAGCDLTFGHFMLTAAYDYHIRYKWASVLEDGLTVPSERKNYHSFSIGMGVTW